MGSAVLLVVTIGGSGSVEAVKADMVTLSSYTLLARSAILTGGPAFACVVCENGGPVSV